MTQSDARDEPSLLTQFWQLVHAPRASTDTGPTLRDRLGRLLRAAVRRRDADSPPGEPGFAAADRIAAAIGELLRGVDGAWLAAHDEAFRPWYGPCHAWLPGAGGPDRACQLRAVRTLGPRWPTPTLCTLAACPDGHVREAAVELLATRSEPVALGALLIRANDWVDAVRSRACQALLARLEHDEPRAWIENLAVAQRLRSSRRADHSALVDAIENRIVTAAGGEVLASSLRDASRDLRRRLASLAARGGSWRACEVAIVDADDVVSTTGARAVLDHPDPATACAWSQRLAGHRSPIARAAALRTAAARCPDGLRDRVVGALEDPVRQVRWAAAYHAERAFGIDVRAHYLELLRAERGRTRTIAALGLRDHGRGEDAPRLAPLLDDDDPRQRIAALQALAALDATAAHPRILPALASPRPGESRVAARLLDRLPPHQHAAELRDLLLSTDLPHVRVQVLRAARRLSKWPQLDLLLRAAALGDPALHELASTHLRTWLQRVNRSFVAPTVSERTALDAALAAAAPGLQDDVVTGLRCAIDAG